MRKAPITLRSVMSMRVSARRYSKREALRWAEMHNRPCNPVGA